jgi:hypothetical protein
MNKQNFMSIKEYHFDYTTKIYIISLLTLGGCLLLPFLLYFLDLFRVSVARAAGRVTRVIIPEHLPDILDLVLELSAYDNVSNVDELYLRSLLLE